jgi:predicted regulator of Ras-like GTPase activity (Roadblock/LC7/MglB family)
MPLNDADRHEANGAKAREAQSVLGPQRSRREETGPAEQLQYLLASFQDRVDGVRGVAVADKSGLPVSSSFATKANVLTVTAMATMAIQSSQRVYQNLGLSGPNEVVMVGPDSTVFVSTVSQAQLSIIVVLEGFANLGLVRIEIERLSRELSEILGI